MNLTHTEIMALEGNALDAAVAEHVMGWTAVDLLGGGRDWATGWDESKNSWDWAPHSGACCEDWSPSTDLNHCAEMERELPEEKRGEYLSALEDVIEDAPLLQLTWAIHTAPPPARCRAALMAVMKELG